MEYGDEQLDPQLDVEFRELLGRTTKGSVKKILERNKALLLKHEVTSEEALQGLTREDLVAFGLATASAAALKEAFHSATTTGRNEEEMIRMAVIAAKAAVGSAAEAFLAPVVPVLKQAQRDTTALCKNSKSKHISPSSANTAQVVTLTTYCNLKWTDNACTYTCCFRNLQPVPQGDARNMEWKGKNETDADNMTVAAQTWGTWLDDPEVLVVAVDGAGWLTIGNQTFNMTGSKTDLLALDRPLLEAAAAALSDEEQALLMAGTAPGDVVVQVASAILMAYELKHEKKIGRKGSAYSVRNQCIAEYVGINIVAGTYDDNDKMSWVSDTDVAVWGGTLALNKTIGVHSVPCTDGQRTLHVTQFLTGHEGRLLAAMRHSLRRAKEARRMQTDSVPPAAPGHGQDPMQTDDDASHQSPRTDSSGHRSSGARGNSAALAGAAHTSSFRGEPGYSAAAAAPAHDPLVLGALREHNSSAGLAALPIEHWLATGNYQCSSSQDAAVSPCSAPAEPHASTPDSHHGHGSSNISSSSGGGSDQELEDVPLDYHARAAFNASWQQAMEQAVNQPFMLKLLGHDKPVLGSVLREQDAYGWVVQVAQAAFRGLQTTSVQQQQQHNT